MAALIDRDRIEAFIRRAAGDGVPRMPYLTAAVQQQHRMAFPS